MPRRIHLHKLPPTRKQRATLRLFVDFENRPPTKNQHPRLRDIQTAIPNADGSRPLKCTVLKRLRALILKGCLYRITTPGKRSCVYALTEKGRQEAEVNRPEFKPRKPKTEGFTTAKYTDMPPWADIPYVQRIIAKRFKNEFELLPPVAMELTLSVTVKFPLKKRYEAKHPETQFFVGVQKGESPDKAWFRQQVDEQMPRFEKIVKDDLEPRPHLLKQPGYQRWAR